MPDIHIREANIDDISTLLQFEQSVINAERPFDPTLKSETFYYDIERMIKSDHIQLLVAECDHDVVACGYARIEESKHFLMHRQYAYLGFMYTEPAYRGKGINKKVIEALIEWSGSRSITEVRLEVYERNTAAVRAYEKAGFTKLMIEMRKAI